MNLLRTIAIGGTMLLCTLAITTLIWLLTLQFTILNRQTTKTWIAQSGLSSKLIEQTINTATQQPIDQANAIISPTILQTALQATFPPSYINHQVDGIVDTTYDWLEGKRSDIAISIPIQDKKSTFVAELAKAVQPQLASLPTCTTTLPQNGDQPVCLPPATNQAAFAKQIAETSIADSPFFNQPLTNTDITGPPAAQSAGEGDKSPQQQTMSLLSRLPAYRQAIGLLIIILPLTAVVCIGLVALLAGDKIRALSRLFRRICFGAGLTLIAAVLMLYIGSHASMLPGVSEQPTAALFVPVLQQVLRGIAGQLALFSSAFTIASGALWLSLSLMHRKQHQIQHNTPKPPQNASQSPPKPTTPPKSNE